MGKHRSGHQDALFVKFMQKHVDIALGYTRANRVAVNKAWIEFVKELNAKGPPSKSVDEWKRVWKDWKQAIKKKVSHNNRIQRTTGNGPYKQHDLSAAERALAIVLQLEHAVDRVGAFGVTPDEDHEENSDAEENEPPTKMLRVDIKDEEAAKIEPVRTPAKSDYLGSASGSNASKALSLVGEGNATLRQMSADIQAISETTKAGLDAFKKMGQMICDLMEQQLEERRAQHVLMTKFFKAHENNQ